MDLETSIEVNDKTIEKFQDMVDYNPGERTYTKEELIGNGVNLEGANLDPFIIRVYKCVECGKWIIDILEQVYQKNER